MQSFDESSPEGCVSYNGNGFYFKKTNDTYLKKVYNEDEIVDLEQSLNSTKRNILTTEHTDIRVDKKFNAATKKFLYNLDLSVFKSFSDMILIVKVIDNGFLVLTDDGCITRTDNGQKVEVLNKLRENFNLSNKLEIYDIVDIALLDNAVIVATKNNGVYKIIFDNNDAELLFNADAVHAIIISHKNTLFVATDALVLQYDIDSGKKIEKYGNIVNAMQLPVKLSRTADMILALAAPSGAYSTENLIHAWKLDSEKLGYNIKDQIIAKHPIDNQYQILFMNQTAEMLYLAGKLRDKLFVWKYDLATMHFSEDIIDCVDIDRFTGFLCIEDNYLILSGRKLFIIKNNEIEEKHILDADCHDFYFQDGNILTISNNEILSVCLPKFEACNDNLQFMIYDNNEACNNIDIFVAGATRSERIRIQDAETGKEIPMSYYIIYNGNSVIKLINCKSQKIKMTVSVNANSSLRGIVVKNNRLFLRG